MSDAPGRPTPGLTACPPPDSGAPNRSPGPQAACFSAVLGPGCLVCKVPGFRAPPGPHLCQWRLPVPACVCFCSWAWDSNIASARRPIEMLEPDEPPWIGRFRRFGKMARVPISNVLQIVRRNLRIHNASATSSPSGRELA
ncbi:unnamed protein product [Amoebophrya sp. A120]|nr:unnamed protein product [Amoebophrya sp. A120]|eukprot:GSA120T00005205001.1